MQAGVKFVVGREGIDTFHEDLAGVRTDTPKHQFLWHISAFDSKGKLLPEVDPGPMGAHGSADKKVQAYNFRLILTDDPANRLPWPRPAGYDAARFELLLNYLQQWKAHTGRDPRLTDVTNPVLIPNHKGDFNNNGAFSTDYLGKSWTYPDASYAERKKIWDDHLFYTEAFFYFLATDPRVPQSVRDDLARWGRSKDEFPDTANWPNQLYIREGRRMVGQYIMRQADLQTDRTKQDSIAMGSYNSDSHNVQRVAMPDGSPMNEGDVQVAVKPYEIAFGTILPAASQTEKPARSRLPLGLPCGIFVGAHGAAIHDDGSGSRRYSLACHRKEASRGQGERRRAAAGAASAGSHSFTSRNARKKARSHRTRKSAVLECCPRAMPSIRFRHARWTGRSCERSCC